ncbi:hypothetical protein ACFE04_026532 [Oxalis oulophora]
MPGQSQWEPVYEVEAGGFFVTFAGVQYRQYAEKLKSVMLACLATHGIRKESLLERPSIICSTLAVADSSGLLQHWRSCVFRTSLAELAEEAINYSPKKHPCKSEFHSFLLSITISALEFYWHLKQELITNMEEEELHRNKKLKQTHPYQVTDAFDNVKQQLDVLSRKLSYVENAIITRKKELEELKNKKEEMDMIFRDKQRVTVSLIEEKGNKELEDLKMEKNERDMIFRDQQRITLNLIEKKDSMIKELESTVATSRKAIDKLNCELKLKEAQVQSKKEEDARRPINANPDQIRILEKIAQALAIQIVELDSSDDQFGMQSGASSHESVRLNIKTTTKVISPSDIGLPEQRDWSESDCLVPPEDQGRCQCCWAIVVACIISSIRYLQGYDENLVIYSYQELIDYGLDWMPEKVKAKKILDKVGCFTSSTKNGFKMVQTYGLSRLKDYGGFKARKQTPSERKECSKKALRNHLIDKLVSIADGDEEAILKALDKHPIAACIDIHQELIDLKKDCIYSGPAPESLFLGGHVVQIIGYGKDEESGIDYYIIRNSWGKKWGNGGDAKESGKFDIRNFELIVVMGRSDIRDFEFIAVIGGRGFSGPKTDTYVMK